MVRYAFVEENVHEYPVEILCRVLELSRSSYYRWLRTQNSPRAQRLRDLKKLIKDAFDKSKGRYGSTRIYRKLKADGVSVCKSTVERLMKELGLKAKKAKRFKRTTLSDQSHPKADNLLDRSFDVKILNQVWLSDITYLPIPNSGKFLYLCVIMDLCSREIVGWSIDETMETKLVIDALHRAIASRGFIPNGCLFHSDQGSQYSALSFVDLLKNYGFVQSMSRRGECWDNAPMESFFDSLKTEYEECCGFESLEDAKDGLFEYIELFYNRSRLHSSIGYRPPSCYAKELDLKGDHVH